MTRITEAYGMPPDLFPNENYAGLWKMGLSELLVCMLSERGSRRRNSMAFQAVLRQVGLVASMNPAKRI